jgi:hypothetical protein
MPVGRDDELLDREVYVGDAYKRFGELTAEDARALAEELSGHSGGGLERHAGPVALAWRRLAERLEEIDAGSVSELDPQEAGELAEAVRVVPPGGSWL